MSRLGLLDAPAFEVGCTIIVEQTNEHFHAHLELEEDLNIGPGDRVRVLGAPVQIAFGQRSIFQRVASVRRAGALRRFWTRLLAQFEIAELYEVSFTPRRAL